MLGMSSMPIMSTIKAYSFFKDIMKNGDLQITFKKRCDVNPRIKTQTCLKEYRI